MFSALVEPSRGENSHDDFPSLSSDIASHASKTRRVSEPRGRHGNRNNKNTRKSVKSLGTTANGGETGAFADNMCNEVCFRTPAAINNVANVCGEWERIPVKLDSGAVATVMPPKVAKHFKVTQTEMSRNGPGFAAANGTYIEHIGQTKVKGVLLTSIYQWR